MGEPVSSHPDLLSRALIRRETQERPVLLAVSLGALLVAAVPLASLFGDMVTVGITLARGEGVFEGWWGWLWPLGRPQLLTDTCHFRSGSCAASWSW